jgi:hypothetical protein
MGVFDEIGGAKASTDSNPVRPGDFDAVIVECKMVKKFNGDVMMLVNMTVTFVREGDLKVGEDVTHFLKVNQPSFLGNVKQFVSATLGCSPDDVGKAEAERVVSEENPLAGKEVRVTARKITTRTGNPFTKVFYNGPAVGDVKAADA